MVLCTPCRQCTCGDVYIHLRQCGDVYTLDSEVVYTPPHCLRCTHHLSLATCSLYNDIHNIIMVLSATLLIRQYQILCKVNLVVVKSMVTFSSRARC